MEPPVQRPASASPVVRRVLLVVGTGAAFLGLVALGFGLAALLSPGDTARPEPVVVRPPPPPRAEPPPPPPGPPPPVAREVPRPTAQVAPPPDPPHPIPSPALPLPARLRIRREVIRGIGGLKDELARCPADPVQRTIPQGRAALVLETESEDGAVRVLGSALEADVPVNDRFVGCVRTVLQGKRLAAPGTKPGVRLKVFLPLGATGNSISLGAASLAEENGQP
jgi:hypothetical protein